MSSDHPLADPPDDAEARNERAADQIRQESDEQERETAERLQDTTQRANEAFQQDRSALAPPDNMERVTSSDPRNAGTAIDTDDSGIEMANLDRNLSNVMDDTSKTPVAERQYNLSRFLAAFSILSGIGTFGNLLYNAIHASKEGKKSDNKVDHDVDERVAALVDQWTSLTDDGYWAALANYVALDQEPPLTLYDQVLFMNYTIDLTPMAPWIWDTSSDLIARVDELFNQYAANGNTTSEMYRHVRTMTYHDAPIPRPVAAELLRYALTKIIVESAGSNHNDQRAVRA